MYVYVTLCVRVFLLQLCVATSDRCKIISDNLNPNRVYLVDPRPETGTS